MSYHELSIEERITLQLGQLQGLSQRAIAKMLNRSPSTISRELRRNGGNTALFCQPSPSADAPTSQKLSARTQA
jgi:IS30 family transposase